MPKAKSQTTKRGRKPSNNPTNNTELFKVMDGIPIPPVRGEESKKLKSTLDALKSGQSFLMPKNNLFHTLKNILNTRKKMFTYRKEGDFIRVWKR